MKREFEIKLESKVEEILSNVKELVLSQGIGLLSVEQAFDYIDSYLRDCENGTSYLNFSEEQFLISSENWYKVRLVERINKLKSLKGKIKDIVDNPNYSLETKEDETLISFKKEFHIEENIDQDNGFTSLDICMSKVEEHLTNAVLGFRELSNPVEVAENYRLQKGLYLKDIYFIIQVLLEAVIIKNDLEHIKTKSASIVASYFRQPNHEKPIPKSLLNNDWNDQAISSVLALLDDMRTITTEKKKELGRKVKKI